MDLDAVTETWDLIETATSGAREAIAALRADPTDERAARRLELAEESVRALLRKPRKR